MQCSSPDLTFQKSTESIVYRHFVQICSLAAAPIFCKKDHALCNISSFYCLEIRDHAKAVGAWLNFCGEVRPCTRDGGGGGVHKLISLVWKKIHTKCILNKKAQKQDFRTLEVVLRCFCSFSLVVLSRFWICFSV